MISLIQKFRQTAAILTGKQNSEPTQPAIEPSLVSKVFDDWPEDEPIRVEIALERFPQLRDSSRAVIELAIKEFKERRSSGEEVSEVDFADRFPGVRSQLLDSLVFEKTLMEMTGWFQSVLAVKDENIVWPKVGDQIAGFQLVEALGSGGFSRVFVARELGYENREVAVKICRQDTHESRTLATLTHSGIGVVHYVRQIPDAGMTAICMPLTSRTTLNDVLRRSATGDARPTSASVAWDELCSGNRIESAEPDWAGKTFVTWAHDLMVNLAQALAASHAQDIVHCDLKPTNVLVTPEGNPKLVDFNVAFRRNAVVSPANVGGTLPYMAPEQIRAFAGGGFSEIGPQTDIYGLAATIYEVLTGKLPFGANTPADDGVETLLERRQVRPESTRATNPQVSREFEELIQDCLNYEPESRPQNAEELIARLKQVAEASAKAGLPRKRLSIARLTVAAAVLLAAVTFLPADGGLSDAPTASNAARVINLDESLAQGFDAMESGDLETAEQTFLAAMQHDPGHEGAVMAWVRANLRMGNVDAAQRGVGMIRYDGTPEKAALRAYCYAGNSRFNEAIPVFRNAVSGGLKTKGMLTGLGYCYYRTTQHNEAIDVLEQARAMDADDPIVKLLLARAYIRAWQQKIPGTQVDQFDAPRLVRLIESCEDSVMKSFVACRVYGMMANKFGRQDPKIGEEWARRSLAAFSRGCELGLSHAYWRDIRTAMPASLLESDECQEFEARAGNLMPIQHSAFFIVDPFIGSRLERWTGRKLLAKNEIESNSLIAVLQ